MRIEIAAPPEFVFATVMDPYRLADWVTIHRSLGKVSADPLVAGAMMDQVLHMHGVSFKVHWRLSSVHAPLVAEWDGRGPAYSRARIIYGLSGDPAGPTTFDYTNEFSAPGGMLGRVASRMVVGAASEREANHSLARLKTLIESTAHRIEGPQRQS
ncbi:MAG: SRPBCC family protein [Solirubrobacteraceae bacterium]